MIGIIDKDAMLPTANMIKTGGGKRVQQITCTIRGISCCVEATTPGKDKQVDFFSYFFFFLMATNK